jgi:Lar family restriction alleviation protein
MSEKLIPCPFCRSKNIEYCTTNEYAHWYECEDCGCNLSAENTKDEALKKWNTRPQSAWELFQDALRNNLPSYVKKVCRKAGFKGTYEEMIVDFLYNVKESEALEILKEIQEELEG